MRMTFALVAGLLGMAGPIAAQKRPTAPVRSAASAMTSASTDYWQTSVGFSAGYMNTYVPSVGLTVASFAAPGIASDAALGVGGIANPPVMFAIFPLHGRLAIEPGLDVHNYSSGSTRATTIAVSARIDYALSHIWYAAAGGQFLYADANSGTVQGETAVGASIAAGARFHLTGPVGARFELGYAFRGSSNNMLGVQTLSYLLGITVPIH